MHIPIHMNDIYIYVCVYAYFDTSNFHLVFLFKNHQPTGTSPWPPGPPVGPRLQRCHLGLCGSCLRVGSGPLPRNARSHGQEFAAWIVVLRVPKSLGWRVSKIFFFNDFNMIWIWFPFMIFLWFQIVGMIFLWFWVRLEKSLMFFLWFWICFCLGFGYDLFYGFLWFFLICFYGFMVFEANSYQNRKESLKES